MKDHHQGEGDTGHPNIVPPLPTLPRVTVDTIPGVVRRVRRCADMSQRELAKDTGVAASTIARIEAGTLVPSFRVLMKLLAPARFALALVDEDGRIMQPMRVWDETLDGGNKKFPAHLDVILDPEDPDDWWGSCFGLARPPETYHRSRGYRDAKRALSQWEVRVKQFRNARRPRDPGPPPHAGR
ncbi:helix-turn-helix transcriptional regulator [Phytoactinopolyspora halotolerans]|uniref:Helix-turn-helix transcriptional regulator n=2 Tax=Phytoactinopolyspora halotolerans TaxID=1981512 RepID=A0A6L9S3W2_9ACTN|nr:helix-turn-helix transcriptional regulator [Phytoactinopolyspora halotolerans]